MCNNQCHTLHFIALHGSLDQASAQEFTKYIGQQSPAALLESALVVVVAMGAVVTATVIAKQDGSHISSVNHRQPPENGGDGQNVCYLLSLNLLVDELDELGNSTWLSIILASIPGSIIAMHAVMCSKVQ